MKPKRTEAKSKRYPSDLTRTQWKRLKRLLPVAKPGGRPRSVNLREVLNGIFYITRGGCAWRMMPKDLPPWSTCYDYFRKWGKDAHKMVSGRKRHLIVDTLGMIMAVVVHAADIQDRDGARLVLAKVKGCFPRLVKVLADGVYNGGIAEGGKQFGGWLLGGVPKPEKGKG